MTKAKFLEIAQQALVAATVAFGMVFASGLASELAPGAEALTKDITESFKPE